MENSKTPVGCRATQRHRPAGLSLTFVGCDVKLGGHTRVDPMNARSALLLLVSPSTDLYKSLCLPSLHRLSLRNRRSQTAFELAVSVYPSRGRSQDYTRSNSRAHPHPALPSIQPPASRTLLLAVGSQGNTLRSRYIGRRLQTAGTF